MITCHKVRRQRKLSIKLDCFHFHFSLQHVHINVDFVETEIISYCCQCKERPFLRPLYSYYFFRLTCLVEKSFSFITLWLDSNKQAKSKDSCESSHWYKILRWNPTVIWTMFSKTKFFGLVFGHLLWMCKF